MGLLNNKWPKYIRLIIIFDKHISTELSQVSNLRAITNAKNQRNQPIRRFQALINYLLASYTNKLILRCIFTMEENGCGQKKS